MQFTFEEYLIALAIMVTIAIICIIHEHTDSEDTPG